MLELTERQLKAFWDNVSISTAGGSCFIWNGSCDTNGYGRTRTQDGMRRTSRVAYKLQHPDWDGSEQINHHCDNPACVNPAHLYAGDQKDNARDRLMRKRNRNQQLTFEQAKELRIKKDAGATRSELAKEYGVSKGIVSRICCNRHYHDEAYVRTGPEFYVNPRYGRWELLFRVDRTEGFKVHSNHDNEEQALSHGRALVKGESA